MCVEIGGVEKLKDYLYRNLSWIEEVDGNYQYYGKILL